MSRDALVVGINIYQDDNLRNLNAPAEDAEAITKVISSKVLSFGRVRTFSQKNILKLKFFRTMMLLQTVRLLLQK